jgi:hypothetical protein
VKKWVKTVEGELNVQGKTYKRSWMKEEGERRKEVS